MRKQDEEKQTVSLSKLHSGAFQGHFGGCPFCGHSSGPYNVRRDHWLVCQEHRVRWWIGENLFSAWRNESPHESEQTRLWLSDFQVVEPAYEVIAKSDGEAPAHER